MGVLESMIGQVAGTGMGMIFQDMQDERNYQNQKRLQKLQMEGGKEMADYAKENQMDIWNRTNYEAQKGHMKAAGLNPALMYGQGGGGGATTGNGGGAMPSGGTAGGGDAGAMGLMQMGIMQAEKAVLESQAEKNMAEAEKIKGVDTNKGEQEITESKARVTNQEFINSINKLYGTDSARMDWNMKGISAEEQNLKWEMYKAIAWGTGNVTDKENNAAKALKAEFEKSVTELENAKKEGRLMDAKTIIENFGAQMAKDGLAPNSPWYIKTIDSLLNKAGIHITK